MLSAPQGQPSLVQYCEGSGIRVMGYSPLGGSSDRAPDAHGTTLLTHPTVSCHNIAAVWVAFASLKTAAMLWLIR